MQKLSDIELQSQPNGKWKVVKHYPYAIRINSMLIVRGIIPAGFICDLDSVPRLPIFYEWLKNRTVIGAVIHDWLCHIGVLKEVADEAFLIAMKMEGVRYRYRWPIYWGVKYFGKIYSDLKKV